MVNQDWLSNLRLSLNYQGIVCGREFFCVECVKSALPDAEDSFTELPADLVLTFNNKGFDLCSSENVCPVCQQNLTQGGIEVNFVVRGLR